MVIRLALVLSVLIGLAACVSPEELRRADEATCTSFGFKPGTPEFATCLQRESLARRYGSVGPGWGPWGPWGWGPGWYPPPPGVMF